MLLLWLGPSQLLSSGRYSAFQLARCIWWWNAGKWFPSDKVHRPWSHTHIIGQFFCECQLWPLKPTNISTAYSICGFASLDTSPDNWSFRRHGVKLIFCGKALCRSCSVSGRNCFFPAPKLLLFDIKTYFSGYRICRTWLHATAH